MEPTSGGTGRSGSALRRYLPVIVIVVVVAVAAGAFVLLRDDVDDDGTDVAVDAATPASVRVFQEGDDPDDFGNCDPETERLAIPTVYAPPCVETFEGDNGGETYRGVTADAITVVVYLGDPRLDPLAVTQASEAGADVDLELSRQTYQGYADMFNELYETYGRTVELEFFVGTGAPDDPVKAKADAIAIAEKQPFAVWGGPVRTDAFVDELVAREILCVALCSLATPQAFLDERAPFIWPQGVTPEQANAHAAEMIGTQLAGAPAEHAGEALQDQERVFGTLHYDDAQARFAEGYEQFRDALADDHGVELAMEVEFTLDLLRAQELARTAIAQLKDAGVTTILFSGDPLMPLYFTQEATRQEYFPEWVFTTTVLVDIALFGRTYDQEQWQHAFGLTLLASRGNIETSDSYGLWDWQYCEEPPANTHGIILPAPLAFFNAVQLAGPDLTPETFRDAMFALPPAGGGPTRPATSRGDQGIWPDTDYTDIDDATMIWWDPDAEGEDEVGEVGRGLYRFTNGGARYRPGEWPDEAIPLFDPEGTVTIVDELPPEDRAPEYPSPCEGG